MLFILCDRKYLLDDSLVSTLKQKSRAVQDNWRVNWEQILQREGITIITASIELSEQQETEEN